MRSKTLTLMTLALLVTGGAATAQTLEEVIAQHLEARGGKEAIQATRSARITGTMTMGPGMEVPLTLEWMHPDRLRMEFVVQGQTGVQAFDGEVGWMHMPFMGKAEPERMPAEQIEQVRQQADAMEGPLVDWQQKGHQVELVGKEEIEGTEAYHLRITLDSGDVVDSYLDADHFLEIKQVRKVRQGDQEVELETSFGNYKEAEGLLFPFAVETRMKGAPASAPTQSMTFESIDLGVEVDESRFAFPGAAEAATPGSGR